MKQLFQWWSGPAARMNALLNMGESEETASVSHGDVVLTALAALALVAAATLEINL